MTGTLAVEVDPSLDPLLPPRRRGRRVHVVADGSALVHVVESVGVPRTEVGALLVDGAPAAPGDRPRAGALVRVLPVARPQPAPTDPPRFLLDVHLGTLARRLRVLGVDAAWDRTLDDPGLVERAAAQDRVLLTRDRGLLRRRALPHGAYVRGQDPEEQVLDVVDRFGLVPRPWTRCTACGGPLAPVAKEEVAAELPEGTRRTYETFARCASCGRVYWHGAHGARLDAFVTRVLDRRA
ncbi:Mut7-C RNAse domain-containing protein [Vallicoccus soli]|uniref:Twitching motility protein PilT n=1 Tax=Vallicoccus soli TaxID=2339232 RepID=A0A3A3ZID7_9ACTN|nr:Mut7-C RNAse domain-containing protein [Vallicoccus soli]RJK95256.1 hypothetical protein D5H78_11305 [Vallicoccus soli]